MSEVISEAREVAPKKQKTTEPLRPEMNAFLKQMENGSKPFPSLMDVPPPRAREIAEIVREPFNKGGPVMASTTEYQLDLPAGSIKIRHYKPTEDKKQPCLFYIHGGGWVLFSLNTHDRLMREYAAGAGVSVIGIDYSHAPEKKYPSQIHEISDAILWCAENADMLGIDRSKLAVGGDSAGGNLSMATSLFLKENGHETLLKAVILNYGVYDARRETESYKRYGAGGYLLDTEEMEWFWGAYLEEPMQALSPLASPIFANVTGLPPTYMAIAEHDVLYDENIHMKKYLEKHNVPVKSKVYTGTIHGFIEASSLGGIACRAIKDTSEWLNSVLS